MAAGPSLSWEIVVAGIGHVLLFSTVAIAKCSSSEEPLFKAEDTIQVALAGPPKNDTQMPQLAERAPTAPKAAPTPPTNQPPPNPSDLAFHTPDAPAPEGDPLADARQRAIDALRRQQALQDLSAPIGKEDRLASNPEGSEEAGTQATSGVNDPELARWVKACEAAVRPNWHPLPSICAANPRLEVIIQVDIDGEGRLTSRPDVRKSSGNLSFDEAARRAVESAGKLPKPPDRFADGMSATSRFNAKECP